MFGSDDNSGVVAARLPSVLTGAQHVLWPHPLVEFFVCEVTQLQRGFAQGQAFGVGFFGDFGRFVVTNVRIECRHQHQATFQMFSHFRRVDFQPGDAMLVEVAAAVCQQLDRLQQVVDDHRLVHVQLQVTLAGGKADGHVVAHHLAGQHRQGFALRRIDLARHDRAARLIGGQFDFGQPRAWAGTQQAEVIGQFHQHDRQGFQRT